MFIWTSGRSSSSYRPDERRNFYQKIKDHDLLDKRKTVTALKAGEDRAILLGLTMMVCSIMMYFLLGITLLRSYMQSVWTEEAQCTLINASITETFNCSFSCGPDCWKISQYPCLQVYVNLTSSGQKVLLYHTEETLKVNSESKVGTKHSVLWNFPKTDGNNKAPTSISGLSKNTSCLNMWLTVINYAPMSDNRRRSPRLMPYLSLLVNFMHISVCLLKQ
uniref:Calcium-activated potassium channel subunit beta-2 n=1 Tax=Leptobrachium leishanense TaxID=445787 RepID=A0A8C5QTF8_9ANUR